MVYQNNLMLLQGKRIHPILQHYAWLEYGQKEILDFTTLSEPLPQTRFGLTASELSQLKDVDRDILRDHLVNLELIFLASDEETLGKIITDNNSQALIESYEMARDNRRFARQISPVLERAAA